MTNKEIAKKLSSFLEELRSILTDCNEGILEETKVRGNLEKIVKGVKEILPKDSRQYKRFDKNTSDIPGCLEKGIGNYTKKSNCKKFEKLISAVKEALKVYQPSFINADFEKSEFYYTKEEPFEAKRKVLDIMEKAKESLIIIDPYAGQDYTILDYVKHIKESNAEMEVRILTEKAEPIFVDLCGDLQKEFVGIKVKKIKRVLHDRFLILDNGEIWNLGTSINGIGKKDFTIKELKDKEEKNKIIKDFETHWENAAKVHNKHSSEDLKEQKNEN